MAAYTPVVLILGAGANIGLHTAEAFASKGYKVALAARRLKDEEANENKLHIHSELANTESVLKAFAKVKARFGIPSVVIYNAAASFKNDESDPLGSLPLEKFVYDMNVNTTGAFVAAQQAVAGFNTIPESASRTFIYTGNILNTTTIASRLDLGMGKSATAHLVRLASETYREKGFKFYYGDERKPDGSPAFGIDGAAHAKLYLELAEDPKQREWQQTFVKGVGYTTF
ncbi:hypothetical protein Plec18170_002244 [Paecilomyces lecythidis]